MRGELNLFEIRTVWMKRNIDGKIASVTNAARSDTLLGTAGSSKYKDVFDVNMRMLPYIIENMPAK